MELTIGILCGGKSSRMGQDKALLNTGAITYIQHTVNKFSDSSDIIISTNSTNHTVISDMFHKQNIRIVQDELSGYGPLEGLRQILRAAAAPYVFVCAVDMPNISLKAAQYVAQFISSDYDAYIFKDKEHIHPLCGIYSSSVLKKIDDLISKDEHRLRMLLDSVRTKYIDLSYSCLPDNLVDNINTPDDYKANKSPYIIAVSGTKNSGKTYITSKLTHALTKSNYTVGVIKHDGHNYSMDHKGTDTYEYAANGALYSAIYNPSKWSINAFNSTDYSSLLQIVPNTDFVILEGFKDEAIDKFYVIRKDTYEPYPVSGNIIGIICDDSEFAKSIAASINLPEKTPIYTFSQIDDLAGVLKNNRDIR